MSGFTINLLRQFHRPAYSRFQFHQYSRNFPGTARLHASRAPRLRRSALDPLTFLLAAVVATGVAYIAAQYTSKEVSSGDLPENETSFVPGAQRFPLTMAPSMPPGRPGNLTTDQEAKLKEMWVATLDIFGVAHEDHVNGTGAPSESSPEGTAFQVFASRIVTT